MLVTSSSTAVPFVPLSNVSDVPLGDEAPDGDNWPLYTNLVYIPGKEPTLSNQNHEVQAIIRKSFDIMGERIIFQNSFPGLADRAIWHRAALQSACYRIFEGCSNFLVQQRYAKLWRRLNDDIAYVRVLSKLVCQLFSLYFLSLIIIQVDARIPHTRGNAKTVAVANATHHFNLKSLSKEQVADLLNEMKYIYPRRADV